MKITGLDIRACALRRDATGRETALRGQAGGQRHDFLVYTLRTECGRSASMFGFAGASAIGSAHLAKTLEPFLMGRNVHDREGLWHDFRLRNRMWGHFPIYIWGPLDCCLWLLAAEVAEVPLYRYIGAAREEVPVYASSMFLNEQEDYVTEALSVRAAGFAGYKLHPPGHSVDADLEIHAAVRAAVGTDYTLMSDPVAMLTLPDALRYGRGLEQLGFAWFEEPMADESLPALRELTRQLDIPVVGTETLAGHPYSLADIVARQVVDAIRADVSWTGGVTGVLKSAHLADAFNMNCEIHTAIFHPLEMVNLHLCAALRNCTYLELLTPVSDFSFGLVGGLPIKDGIARLPETPGLGVPLDWDLIEDSTLEVMT
ncbi:L-alanine-DL-glutamate epimerase-like enolase superfamily enzyme [Rhodovulum imhoffii]|uniref:L-alanine-DL-glutamate epimerase-like enolase superfamily enzyme n=1 Tax=Rhodovulum imhoffii TaxID=365340 RepID=A0A2T5BSE0_9RHOB|nr:enolase C-terminal domain-like protein [Rhodovulum imhoffii]MBK5933503.1 mandelate racemase [Rhodovulum imhoffii]PTN02261.1 L-alanine-DL-glutamate epimerase-like enolase superfamily enzyme [Rhodovulum imhoffii]